MYQITTISVFFFMDSKVFYQITFNDALYAYIYYWNVEKPTDSSALMYFLVYLNIYQSFVDSYFLLLFLQQKR